MKHRFSLVILVAAAVGFMLWGCSSGTQDPVSSTNGYAEVGPVKVLHKVISAPTNVLAVVNGFTVTISWDSVATAVNYHVVVHANGNPYVDTIFYAQQLVLTKVPAGSYTVTVAAILTGLAEGTASPPVSFTLSSVVAPTVTAIASPLPFCFRNGEWVTVTFSGIVVNTEGGASYELKDEYNKIHYTGTVPAGPYAVKLNLKDRNIWFDSDGRQYTFTITATNSAGTAKASVTVTIPRDRNFWNWKDDDGWDDHR
jgi:hypothetical protein